LILLGGVVIDNGYLEYGSGTFLCKFSSVNNWAGYEGGTPKIYCSFQITNRFEMEDSNE